MFAYWVILGVFFIAALSRRDSLNPDGSQRKMFIFFAFFILIIMAGFRGIEVGTDTSHYVSFFRSMPELNSLRDFLECRYEIGFVILFKLISFVSTEPSCMIFVTSAIVVCLYGRYIIKSSTDIYMSFMLFVLFGFYMSSFNIIRQHIAVGICLNGLLFLKKTDLGKVKSTLLFIASVFIASQFHTSAWLFLIVLLCPLSERFPTVIVLEVLATLVLFIFKDEITLLFSTWFGYENYLVLHTQRASYLTFVVYFVISVLILLFLLVMEKRSEVFQSIKIEFHMLCMAMVIITITLSEYGLIVRMADYFKPVIIVILPRLFKDLRGKDKTIAICMVCVVGCLFYGWSLFVNNGEVVPYVTIFK